MSKPKAAASKVKANQANTRKLTPAELKVQNEAIANQILMEGQDDAAYQSMLYVQDKKKAADLIAENN